VMNVIKMNQLFKRNVHAYDLLLCSIMPFLVTLLSVFVHFLPLNGVSVWIRLLLGITALILIPGYCVTKIIFKSVYSVEMFGFSLLFGIGIQMINILLLYSVVSTFFCEQINFGLTLTFLTVISTLICCMGRIIKEKRGNTNLHISTQDDVVQRKSKTLSIEKLLFPVFIIAVILRLYFQSFSLGPVSDGALYLGYARNLVQDGIFASKVSVTDWIGVSESMLSTGFIPHSGTPFVLAIFFDIGGISYSVGKMMAVFFGALLVFPVYGIAKELFSVKAGLIASAIVAVHPFLLEYSSMLHGPEIMGAVFLASSFYFLLLSIQRSQSWQAILAGFFAFLTGLSWEANFYVYLATIPMLIILLKKEIDVKNSFLIFFVVGLWGFTLKFSAGFPFGLAFHIGIPTLLVLVAFLKRRKVWARLFCFFLLTLNLFLEFFVFVRQYYFTEVYINPASEIPTGTWITSTVSQLVSVTGIGDFLNRIYSYLLPAYLNNLSPILISLGIMAFIFLKTWRKKLSVLLFPSFQMVLYGIFVSESMLSLTVGNAENRLLLGATPFFAILAAVFIDQLTVSLVSTYESQKKILLGLRKFKFSINFSTIFIAIMIASVFLIQFGSRYETVMNQIRYKDIKTLYHLDAAIHWVNENVGPDDIIMTRKPFEWTWYTDRKTVTFEQNIDLYEMRTLIKKYRVNYVIVDPIFNEWYYNLQDLYTSPEIPPPGFQLVFRSDNTDGIKILIYNTTECIYTDFGSSWFPSDYQTILL